jgi:hypothetical protein
MSDPLNENPAGTAAATATMNQQINNPGLPAGTEVQPVLATDSAATEQNPNGYAVDPNGVTAGQTAATGTAVTGDAPTPVTASTYDATTASGQTPQMTAAQGTVDPNSLATAAQAEVDPRATVKGQLTDLLQDPDQTWAQGATRKANETMAARGLGSSTMAGEAITNAAIESALPIAQADAQIYATYGLANLNNRQAVALQNAQQYASINLANLNNEQQANITNQQARLTTLLSDQAADNAAKNFNATSENQVAEFMSQLSQQASQFAAGQVNAMTQFNAGQTNSWQQFQDNLVNQRDQFNSTQAATIDAANVAWRRSLNTANTAAVNAANATNAQNRLNLSNYALNAVWQEARDEANFAFTQSENQATRAGNIAMAAFQNAAYKDLLDDQQKAQLGNLLGQVGISFLAAL